MNAALAAFQSCLTLMLPDHEVVAMNSLKKDKVTDNHAAYESTATSSQVQVIRYVPERRANGEIDDGVVVLFACLAVVLLGLVFCTAAAIGFLVRHVRL